MYWKQVQRLPSTFVLVFGSSGAVPGVNDRNTQKLRTRKSEVEAGKVKGRHRPLRKVRRQQIQHLRVYLRQETIKYCEERDSCLGILSILNIE